MKIRAFLPAFAVALFAGVAINSAAAAEVEALLPTSLELETQTPAPTTTPAPTKATAASKKAPALLSTERLHSDPEVFWKGFLTGLRGFEQFHNPIGSPIYFESPLINTEIRPIFMHHVFPQSSQLKGGQVNVIAAQARVALTDRLAFIATKDGFSFISTGILGTEDGWNDIAAGLKYAFWVDEANEFIATGGVRYEFANGSSRTLQRSDQEWSPFLSVAKGFGDFHAVAGVSYRIPEHPDKGNEILHWDFSFSYDIAKEVLPGFAPVLEFHGIHYLTNGKALGLDVGGVDYNNLGTTGAEGVSTITAGVGARWRLSPHASVGALFEMPLTRAGNDITLNRLTFDIIFTY